MPGKNGVNNGLETANARVKFQPATPRSGQEEYFNSIECNQITICTGLAGSGKTLLALSAALKRLYKGKQSGGVKRVVVIRPYIQSNTGEKLGALPGDLRDKVCPYVEGIKDNLRELIHDESQIATLINSKFEFTILSMCRGRSFNDCFVIVEEAQNVPLAGEAMKMILTRVGTNCKMVIAGDLDQCDIDSRDSGLVQAINVLNGLHNVGIVEMSDVDCVQRSPIVRDILMRYSQEVAV
jgi:phosphate starvation-inducible PhoH-like protein